VVHRVAALCRVAAAAVKSGSKERKVVVARAIVSYAAVVGLKASLTDVARALGVGTSSVLRGVRRGAHDMHESGLHLPELFD
jgi:chromosomal replication initiation ATPase DnaA